jgi:hypothetical protein
MVAWLSRIFSALLDWLLWPWTTLSDISADTGATRGAVGALLRNEEMIIHKLESLGVLMSEATDLLVQINDETNAVASRIDALVAELENESDASPEVLQGLRDLSVRLGGLAADPDNPVPPVEEPPVDNGGDNIPPMNG